MKKLLSFSMAALCLLSCAVGCGDSDSDSGSKKKSKSSFVGKWEGKSFKMGDMTLESLMGIPMYAVVHAEIKDDGSLIITSPIEDLDIPGMETESVGEQEGSWKKVDKDTIEVTITAENKDGEEETQTVSFDLVDNLLVMTEEESKDDESGLNLGGSFSLIKVDEFTEVDLDQIKKDFENGSLGLGSLLGDTDLDDVDLGDFNLDDIDLGDSGFDFGD